MQKKILETTTFLEKKITSPPLLGMVLGSGFSPFVEEIKDKVRIPYEEIPHFIPCTVEGHSGELIFGNIANTDVAVLSGRVHAYEGIPLNDLVFPLRVLGKIGIKSALLTNAAGGINRDYQPGDIVLIRDHLNLTGNNVLIGANPDFLGPRFPDMGTTYHPEFLKILIQSAKEIGIDLKTGVYAGVLGPNYETPAEVQMLKTLGADLVGMSTVQEAIALRHMGIKISALSCVTNMAAGIHRGELKHEHVKEQAKKAMEQFNQILLKSVPLLGK